MVMGNVTKRFVPERLPHQPYPSAKFQFYRHYTDLATDDHNRGTMTSTDHKTPGTWHRSIGRISV